MEVTPTGFGQLTALYWVFDCTFCARIQHVPRRIWTALLVNFPVQVYSKHWFFMVLIWIEVGGYVSSARVSV